MLRTAWTWGIELCPRETHVLALLKLCSRDERIVIDAVSAVEKYRGAAQSTCGGCG